MLVIRFQQEGKRGEKYPTQPEHPLKVVGLATELHEAFSRAVPGALLSHTNSNAWTATAPTAVWEGEASNRLQACSVWHTHII